MQKKIYLSKKGKVNIIFKKKISKSFIYDEQKNVKIDYKIIYKKNSEFSKLLDKNKNSVILVAENSVDFLVAYYCLIQNNFLVILIGSNITDKKLENLVYKFKPNFVCYSKKLIFKNILSKKLFSSFFDYNLFLINSNIAKINNEICLLLPTSGSTGESKFVKLTYKNIISNITKISKFLAVDTKDITITTLPPEYSYGLSIINSHLFKNSSIIMNSKSVIEDSFWKIIEKFKVNSFGGVPFTYELLKRIDLRKKLILIKSIKYLTQAGGKLSTELQEYMNYISKKYKFKFYVMYGSTEASPRMSMMLSNNKNKIGSIGKALEGCSFLVRKNGKKIVKPYLKGDLYFKGDNIFVGYANSNNDIKNIKNIKILKTGDYGYFDEDNYFYVEGRTDRITKLNGIRLDLNDLENELKKELLIDLRISTNGNKLKIFLIKNIENIVEFKSKLSKISNIHPSNLKIFILKEFPLTRSSKTDYNKLNKFDDK